MERRPLDPGTSARYSHGVLPLRCAERRAIAMDDHPFGATAELCEMRGDGVEDRLRGGYFPNRRRCLWRDELAGHGPLRLLPLPIDHDSSTQEVDTVDREPCRLAEAQPESDTEHDRDAERR